MTYRDKVSLLNNVKVIPKCKVRQLKCCEHTYSITLVTSLCYCYGSYPSFFCSHYPYYYHYYCYNHYFYYDSINTAPDAVNADTITELLQQTTTTTYDAINSATMARSIGVPTAKDVRSHGR